MDYNKQESIFFLAILLGVSVLAIAMLRSYLYTLVMAIVFAILFYRLNERLTARLKQRTAASLLTTIILVIVIFVPFFLLSFQLLREAQDIYAALRGQAGQIQSEVLLTQGEDFLNGIVPGINVDRSDLLGRLQEVPRWIIQNLSGVFAGITGFFGHFFLMLFIFFFLLRDGHKAIARVMEISPLTGATETYIFQRLAQAVNSIIRGSLVVAMIQGIVAGVGFMLFGVPSALLLGSLAALASFIPSIGTSLVLVPAIVYLLFTGHIIAAAGLAIWGMLAVGLIDNLLTPFLLGRQARMHPLVVMLGILGGVSLFGLIGIILGPIVMSLWFTLVDVYFERYQERTGAGSAQ